MSDSPPWLQVKAVLPRLPLDWSPYDEAFARHGANGTVVTDQPPSIAGYLPPETNPAPLQTELQALGASSVHTEPVPETDWAEAWKQFFVPRRVGQTFVIVPSWEDFHPAPEDKVIHLDPGQAFGTGDHPTTRMVLEIMEDTPIDGKDVADIGSGSGVLSVGAALLGARSIHAVDVEPVSVRSTLDNLARNHRPDHPEPLVKIGLGFDPLPPEATYDIVLSNIISAALVNLAPEAARRVRPGGSWIVSGIIHPNWPDVHTAATKAGFTLHTKKEEGDWLAARFTP